MKPIVAIVGRPNVGKSTLFNRLIQRRLAIVESQPGVTRDRIYADAEWNGRVFAVVDTGGIEVDTDFLKVQTTRQAELAIAEADLVLFVVDARTGVTPADQDVAEVLRRTQKPVLLVANKVDPGQDDERASVFFELGFGAPLAVSAAHGTGTGDLLDEVVQRLPPVQDEEPAERTVQVAVVGRPNVGKSSLVNALLGQERMIVSDIPGTTRDAIDIEVVRGDQRFVLIDTAGMRRRARIEEAVERYSVMRALRAIDRSDVVLIIIDASQGLADQDKKIAGYVDEAGKASLVVVNKWDLVEKDEKTMHRYRDDLREGLSFMSYARFLFISAKTGARVHRLLGQVMEVYEQYCRQLPTKDLNELIRDALLLNPPPVYRGRQFRLHFVTQTGSKPPSVTLFVSDPKAVHYSYHRYLENQLRAAFGLEGTPIRLYFHKRD
ncbi:MAG: ribosome biogenesis GTPase Der [Bacillota bacterium]